MERRGGERGAQYGHLQQDGGGGREGKGGCGCVGQQVIEGVSCLPGEEEGGRGREGGGGQGRGRCPGDLSQVEGTLRRKTHQLRSPGQRRGWWKQQESENELKQEHHHGITELVVCSHHGSTDQVSSWIRRLEERDQEAPSNAKRGRIWRSHVKRIKSEIKLNPCNNSIAIKSNFAENAQCLPRSLPTHLFVLHTSVQEGGREFYKTDITLRGQI